MIDLHAHSLYSDGSDSPSRVVELAAEAGCWAVALTDHDTINGISEARTRGDELGIRLIAGVELSCQQDHRNVHILGYFLDINSQDLKNALAVQRESRDGRNLRLVDRLNEIGLRISMEDVVTQAGVESVGRPHFAAALMANDEVGSIEEAFTRFLGEGTPGYVERHELEAAEAIGLIKAAGGVASWAHPLTPIRYRDDDLQPELDQMIAAGLVGIEANYSAYDNTQRKRLTKLARKHELVPTGGSDYHGTFKPRLSMGVGLGDLNVENEILEELESRR